jgi:RNA-binding protein
MALTGKQRAHLRGLAHALDPVVQIGAGGLSEAVVRKVDVELEHHELIKVRIGEAPEGAAEVAPRLAEATGAEVAQVIGKTIVLYRRRKKDPEIRLPPAG